MPFRFRKINHLVKDLLRSGSSPALESPGIDASIQSKSVKNKILAGLLILYSIILYLYESNSLLYFGIDWRWTFYPAAKLLLHGQNPYLITTFRNPIWALFPLIPFTLIGEQAGKIAIFYAAFLTYILVARKMGASSLALIFFMASPLIIYNLMLGNIDWLVMLGFIMPPSIGLFFVILKPQIGIAVVAYWLWTSFKNGGFKNLIKTFYPVTIAIAISFLVFGNWLIGRNDELISVHWNFSFFPYSIPIGLILLYLARKKIGLAISASPFFSPYLSAGSWSIVQLGIIENNVFTFASTIGLWMLYALVLIIR